MHLPDGIIPLNQAIIYWIITLIIVCLFLYKLSENGKKEKHIVAMAIYAVFTTVISSLSIPSPLGVPIHFFTIPLLVFLLGPLSASFVCLISLLAQALLLGMGGITSFGANFLIIGFVLSSITWIFFKIFNSINKQYAVFIATVMGIIFAALGQSIVLLLSGTMTLEALLSTLIPFYLFVSIIEGILTVLIINAITRVKPELLNNNKI